MLISWFMKQGNHYLPDYLILLLHTLQVSIRRYRNK